MHLLYLSAPGGGLDTNVRVLAPELVQAGHCVSVVYLHFPGEKTAPQNNQVDGYTVYHAAIGGWHYYAHRATLGLTSLPNIIRAFEYAQTLSKVVREIHSRQPLDLIELPEVLATPRLLSGIPYVMRLHSSAWMCRRMFAERSPLSDSVESMLEKRALGGAAGISSPSRFVADYIRQTCRVTQPIEIIPYPIDTTRFAPGARKDDPPMILFVGRMEKRKGADVLLRSIPLVRQKFPDCNFVFAGSMSEDMRSLSIQGDYSPRSEAEWGGWGEGRGGVRLLGVRPREELIAWYQRAAIFVAPSLWDNSPNTIYEAMACGTPVVATRVGGIPELVDDGVTGLLVPPRDVNALADAIIALLDDCERREQMECAAREKAVAEFALPMIATRTLGFYDHNALGKTTDANDQS